MLSRSNSNATNPIHRSKSSSSVRERRKYPLTSESIDPETAHIHALIAAHRAMDRSSGIGRSDSTASKHPASTTRQFPHRLHSPASELQRQRSILQTKTSTVAGSRLQPVVNTCDEFTVASMHPSVCSDFGESYGAEPSSYRRLHRSRSMFSPPRQWQLSNASGSQTPLSQARTLRHAASAIGSEGSSLGLRIRRSFNFLRTPNRVTTVPVRTQKDSSPRPEAVKLAREQFLRSLAKIESGTESSPASCSKLRKKHVPFRESLRRRDEVSGDGSSSSTPAKQKSPTLKKVHSISQSLRLRFKRAFSKTKFETGGLPPQQVQSSSSHLGDKSITVSHELGFDPCAEDCFGNSGRESLYISCSADSLKAEDAESLWQAIRLDSNSESSTSNSRSRVTSWTNSTVTESSQGNYPDRKRLSIIKEDGSPHQPSSSAGRHLGGVSASQPPFPTYNAESPDSQRLYSALIKRIKQGSNSPTLSSDERENITNINADVNETSKSASTIRWVPTEPTTRKVAPDSGHREFSLKPSSWLESSGMTPEKLSENIKRRKEKLKTQEAQSKFFPHSVGSKPKTASPFKKLLLARRSDDEGGLIGYYENHQRQNPDTGSLPYGRYTLSSESLYSRTTNGGTNSQYEPPITSMEELPFEGEDSISDTGFATIIPTRSRVQPLHMESPVQITPNVTNTDKSARKNWMEDQMSSIRRSSSKASNHIRENTQINPEATSVNVQGTSIGSFTQRITPNNNANNLATTPKPTTTHEQILVTKRRLHFPSVKDVSTQQAPAFGQSSSPSCDHNGDIQNFNDKQSGPADESHATEKGKYGSLRKISPGNVAKLLRKRRSCPTTRFQNDNEKENKPIISTRVPSESPASFSELHKGVSKSNLRMRQTKLHSKHRNVSTETVICHTDDSPTDRVKATLSARLSRPFDMTTPECNRPFDSMYLGKREMGFGDNIGGRLSVAQGLMPQKGNGGYGGLGTPILDRPINEEGTTALPQFPTPKDEQKKVGSRFAISTNSKRMVSNFLRSRRNTSRKDQGDMDDAMKEAAEAR